MGDAVVYFKSASDNPQLVGQRLRSQIVAALTRFFIAFERRWYDLLAESSPAEVNFGIFTGFVLTFLAVWLSLSALLNALNPVPLPLSRSFQVHFFFSFLIGAGVSIHGGGAVRL